MKPAYITVYQDGRDEHTVQKSRFIGYARPCGTEEEAAAFLKEIRERHRDARHHCYAYIIGINQGIMRYSDDGEPGGTAGLPMISLMRSRCIVNCCVVVVRYFGGILLGTGGLVRAYTLGCQIALDAARPVRMEWSLADLCEVPYNQWSQTQHALEHLPARLENPEFGVAVTFRLLTREADHDRVLEELQKVTGRQLETLPEEPDYLAWDL